MKKILIITMLVFSFVAGNAQQTKKQKRKAEKAEKEANLIAEIKTLLESKVYVFSATQALPSGMRNVNLDTSYNLKINNDTAACYLPFYGRAYSAGYGTGEGPFDFTLPIENYKFEQAKKGGYQVQFDVKNKNDNLNFSFQIGSTGSTSLVIISTNRQSISFHGDIEKIDDKK